MKRTTRLIWLLVTLIVVLTPMAWASPIDPTWVKGMYDDADFDDVVTYLTSGSVAIPVLPVAGVLPVFVSVPAEIVPDHQSGPAPLLSSQAPRAPPLG